MLNEIFAREILETSIALGILQKMNGGYSFEERKAFWNSFFDFKAPKLRLPVKIAKRSGCKL